MKKQILILVLLVMATFASVTVFGQTARPLTCAVGSESPLFPALGKTYTYTVEVPNAAVIGATPNLRYTWFVTKDPGIIVSGALTAARATLNTDFVVASGTYNAATTSNASMQLKWKTLASPTVPFFLVVSVIGDNGTCSPQNTKVYKIEPQNFFTLDIVNVNSATDAVLGVDATTGVAVEYTQCMQNIQSATWLVAKPTELQYDYGTNTLKWAVNAANWTKSWGPNLKTTGIDANETVSVTWSTNVDGTGTGGTFSTADAGATWTTGDSIKSATSVDAAGSVIYITMVLDHTTATTQFEGLADEAITLAIDAKTANGDADVHYSDTKPEDNLLCGKADDFTYDITTQTVKARPGIDSKTVDASNAAQDLLTPVK